MNDDSHMHDELHDDDKPVGRLLSRREMLTLLGGGSAALVAGLSLPQWVAAQSDSPTATPLPSCVVKPELTEGPYFVGNDLNRMDIRIDPTDGTVKDGLPLKLVYRVTDVTGGACTPLEGAQVDIWHCDAEGVYSGVNNPGADASGALWLRGYQVTNADGLAEFITIVPGWYPGRAVHIHFKIRTTGTDGQDYEFTSQLFFDPEQIETFYAEPPYVANGLPDRPNEQDGIFQQSEGLLTLALDPLGTEDLEALDLESGYQAMFDVGLDLSDTQVGASDGNGGGGFGGGRGGFGGGRGG